MRISDFTNNSLWFFVFIIAQLPQRGLTASNAQNCGRSLERADSNSVLIGPVCSKNYLKYIDCLQINISKSDHPNDKKIYNSMDFTNLNKKTTKFCNNFTKIHFERKNCDTSFIKNYAKSKICLDDHLRLEYLKLDKCPLNVLMLWYNYRDSAFRNGCLIIDPWYQVIPRYGPEVVCYKDFIEKHEDLRTDNTSPIEVYETFCQQFDHNSVFDCVDRTYDALKPDEFESLERKKKQKCAAKMFVEKRRQLCQRFRHVEKKRPDLNRTLACKETLALTRNSSMEKLATNYSECLRVSSELSQLIFDNLMAYKDINICRSDRSYFDYITSGTGFRFPAVAHLLLMFLIQQFVFT